MLSTTTLDITGIRKDFPILNRKVHGKPLVYLDNAATSQKPQIVIDALTSYYAGYNANIHRGLHSLADEATAAYEQTRTAIARWIGAATPEEIVFTRGTTEGINLIAHSFGQSLLKPGDEVLISALEHHSNIVPWQMACERSGATLKVIPMHDDGSLNLDDLDTLLTERTKMVACIYVSNALGTINPIEKLTTAAHRVGASILVDAAQATPHMAIDVQAIGCDYLVFSGHKVLGPTGIGILYGKKSLLESLPPYQGGGEMIQEVSFERTTYNVLPYKFEAGTPNIADTIALHKAIEYMQYIGYEAIAAHEHSLLEYATARLSEVEGVRVVGTAKEKASVVSFLAEGAHPQDIGILLDQEGVAIRTGHHCAQPIMQRLGIPGTCRASFAFYNSHEEIDVLVHALQKALRMLR
jgi:cysteine desulfurase/selenocysteine lyase